MSHNVTIGWVADNHGYPYRATCSCGWQSRTYAAKHAAQAMADEHVSSTMGAVTVREYTPHSGRIGYSVVSADESRVYLVTPKAGPGKFSPIQGWLVWKSDSLNTAASFAGTDSGRDAAIARAKELAAVR